MRFQLSDPSKTDQLAFAFMLTAYTRCGGETGLGLLQAVHDMTLDSVRQHVSVRPSYTNKGWTALYGDYVAGRMVKTGIEFDPNAGLVEISDNAPRPDYQGWASGVPEDPGVLLQWRPSAGKLASYHALLLTAAQLVDVQLTEVSAVTADAAATA
jgi:hypothetical protein